MKQHPSFNIEQVRLQLERGRRVFTHISEHELHGELNYRQRNNIMFITGCSKEDDNGQCNGHTDDEYKEIEYSWGN